MASKDYLMKKYVVAIFLTLSGAAQAQTQAPQPMDGCKAQIELYCKEEAQKKDLREVVGCLSRNDDKLSTQCKQEIQRFVQASRQTAPPGGGPPGALAGLTGAGSQIPTIAYEGRYLPSSDTGKKAPSIIENNLNISIPVYKTETDTYSATISAGSLHLGEPVALDSGDAIPTDFYKGEVGFGYSRRLSGHKNFGLRGSYGFFGDKSTANTKSFNLNANYAFPGSKENTMWVLLVMMSNNSPLGTMIPFPGFIYIYRTPTFTGMFGIPVISVQWTPVNPWSFSFSALGPQLKSEITYGAIDETQFFAGLAWKQQRFSLSTRTEEDERVIVEEKNAEIGARRSLFQKVSSEVGAGYSFNRYIYQGEDLFDRSGGSIDLEPTWYLRLSLRMAF